MAHHKLMNIPFSLFCNTRFPFHFCLWPTLKYMSVSFLFKALPKGYMYFLARDTQYTVFLNLFIRIWNNLWANLSFFIFLNRHCFEYWTYLNKLICILLCSLIMKCGAFDIKAKASVAHAIFDWGCQRLSDLEISSHPVDSVTDWNLEQTALCNYILWLQEISKYWNM